MTKRKIVKRVIRKERVPPEEAARLDEIRRLAMKDFPPAKRPRLRLAADGIGAEVRKARLAQGLTWYAVAKRARIPRAGTVRAIEYGRDVKLSSLQAVAKALGLKIELVEAKLIDRMRRR
jgi:transcriptional regulator with XRE-family HTH domain